MQRTPKVRHTESRKLEMRDEITPFAPLFRFIEGCFVCPASPLSRISLSRISLQRARIVPALPNVTATATRRIPVRSIPSVRILQSWSRTFAFSE